MTLLLQIAIKGYYTTKTISYPKVLGKRFWRPKVFPCYRSGTIQGWFGHIDTLMDSIVKLVHDLGEPNSDPQKVSW